MIVDSEYLFNGEILRIFESFVAFPTPHPLARPPLVVVGGGRDNKTRHWNVDDYMVVRREVVGKTGAGGGGGDGERRLGDCGAERGRCTG